MLVELLFLVEEGRPLQAVCGMVQYNGPQWQAFGIYPLISRGSPESRGLGMFATKELAMEAAESDARREYRALSGVSADDTPTEAIDQTIPELAEAVSA